MMRNVMYNTNDINKYCAYAKCQKSIEYSKLKTASNDPSISQKMKYANYVRRPGVACSKVLDPLGQIVGE